jgi:hypothetical protein
MPKLLRPANLAQTQFNQEHGYELMSRFYCQNVTFFPRNIKTMDWQFLVAIYRGSGGRWLDRAYMAGV